jgi:hypothetical protein
MTIKTSSDGSTAVDHDYFWRDMSEAPYSVKVQLLSKYGVASYGVVTPMSIETGYWTHWAPLPKLRKTA